MGRRQRERNEFHKDLPLQWQVGCDMNFYILYGTQVVIGAFVGPLIPLTVVCLYHELKRV